MEMKEIAKHKTLGKMSSTSESLLVTGVEVNPLKKFTIPKIRKTAGKVYLSPCCTNTREYSFIHDILNQCRLDISCDLRSSWQFGDTKLVHNEDLEKNFTSKRSEMRESGRHGRELEEHFCFLALPQSEVAEIYQNGISTKASTLKILGNPLLGIYIFRHIDVALNYAHTRSITVESIIIFKVLFGKVKKIQPSVNKNKISLDPSPNFDCHMSRSIPSLKDTIELQAYSSAVYIYEYNVLSKPVDKPRQCLPYAIVTVKFIGQKGDNGHLTTSLRVLSTGLPKRTGRTSLNNCTVAKRIGKGKDATVIFEQFRKPIDPFVQENCSCTAINSEIKPSNSNISNTYGNVQNGNISIHETYSGQMEHNLIECRDTSQVHACDSCLSLVSSDTRESVNGDPLLSLTHHKDILSGRSAAFTQHNNTGSSTVITSKLIKDPRLLRREESMRKHNNITGLNEFLPSEKILDFVNSEINLSMPTNSASSSEVKPGHHAILTNCLDAPCFRIFFDKSQSQAHNMGSKNYDYTVPNKITMEGQCQEQDSFSFPMRLSSISEVENQTHSEEEAQRSHQKSNILRLIEQNSEPHNSYESVNTFTKGHNNHFSQESQSPNLKTVCQTVHQTSTIFPFQRKESIHDEYIQNIGKMRNFTDPVDNSKHGEKQNSWKEIDNCINKTKISPVNSSISLHQEYKQDESESLDSFEKKCDHVVITQEIPKSSTSTTKGKDEPDYLALELQNDFTPRVESLSQKHSQHYLEYEDNIHTSFDISQKLMDLKLEKSNQNCVSIITDAFQETKDIPQTRELPIDTVVSSHDFKTVHDDLNCSIAREHIYIHEKNESDPASLENIQRDYKETPQIDNKGKDHTLFYNAQLNNDTDLNIDFKEQRYKENQNEATEEDIASSTENNIDRICGDETQVFHTNENFTNIDERRENKYSVEILSSDEFSTFNLTWGKKYVSTETILLETEDSVTIIKQKDTQNTERSIKHLASILPKIAGSSVHVASNAAVEMVPVLSTNDEDHQRYQVKQTCSPENPDFGLLIKHTVSDCKMDVDKNKLHDSLYQSISDNSVLQSFELENVNKGGSEQCDDTLLFQQDTHSHGNILYEEFEASYETLKSRIDWEGLFGSSNGEKEVLKSTTGRENSNQHYSQESSCFYSSIQKNKAEFFKPILLPDLQVRITNDTVTPGFSSSVEPLALKDNFCKYITEATKPEINEEEGKVLGFEIYSQCSGENSHYPCEDELDNIRQESGLMSKSEISLSSEEQNSDPLLTEPSNITTIIKIDYNDTKSRKGSKSRTTKRKLRTPFTDQNIPHSDLRHEVCEKRRRLTSYNSLECFPSLSKGQIKTFSQSEKNIRSALSILNSEASLCKSKCLSRKLDRAVLHFKKAHKRVPMSLQLIAKVDGKSKGPLPKSYAIICNNFWEICDHPGYSYVSERRYYSRNHFLSRRKYDIPGEKRPLAFEVDKSLSHVSKYKSGCLFSPEHPDEKLTKKENQVDVKSNISKYEKLEKHSVHNNNDAIKASAEVKTDIVISVIKSNVKHFLNVDIYKPDNLILSGCKRNLEGSFSVEKWTASSESSKPGTITGNVHMDPLNLTAITSETCNSIPQLLSVAPMTDSEGESSKSYLDEQGSFAIDSFAISNNVPHCQQRCGKELKKTEQCFPSSCFYIDGNEINVTENSELDLIPVTQESKSYGENIMKRLFSSDSSLLLKGNARSSSKNSAEKGIHDRKMWKVKQAEKAKDSIHKKNMTKGSTVKTEYRNQKSKILEESSYLSEKIIKNNFNESNLSIKNTTEAISLNNTVSKLSKGEKKGGVKVSNDSQSDSFLHSEIACNSKPDVIRMNHMPTIHACSETSKITTTQKKPTLYMNELKEKHSINHSGLLARLAHILRRADETSSLQSLQEETKVCQNILPLFVEAFERKQECSLEQVLISRELLVEQNLWNNYKHKLKPCAIDSLVELQMMMETIQFIENKKRLLEGELTFRSLLWYDDTLYSELLGRPRGFQQQSNFYPAFQGRLKYNAFCELQNYHDQLIELFEETKRENNSYYAVLKYKRQINECEAILKHCSDCFDFSLSVPFTCGVNFGDSLGDLETLRKSTLKLISVYGDSPKVDSYPGKQDHLWIIIEMISSKVNFIKSSEAVGINISLYGLEHIFFDAAKSLVWKEKRQSFSKKYSGQKNKETLLKMNQYSFSKLQKIYETLSKYLSSEKISSIGLEENAMIVSKESVDVIDRATVCIEDCRFNSTLLSHPDICCISEILDQAEFADFKKLQKLTLRCNDHLEILKKYFHILQEDNRDIFITEENVLDMVKNHNHEAIILKPAAIETYIEISMLSETVHFLKNSMAKKLDRQRFRGMLWFDLSLLPELVQCQEKMASFSYLRNNPTESLWKVIETAISEVKDDLDITYKYNEAVNCSYALHLFSRELEELSEIKNLLKKSKYFISTYIDFVPYIASVNYGSTVVELEYNYNQFSTLLKNILAAPRRDLGKVAHIMRVMKTIEHMKIICAENAELTISFVLCQMLHNEKKTFQLKRKEKMNVHAKPRKSIKSSICMKVASVSECIMKNVSNSSKKRPVTIEECGDSQEQEKNTTVPSCKKQKVNMEDVTKISREKATFKHPRTTRSHPRRENEIGPSLSDSLKRNHVSQKNVEMQRPLPGSTLPLKNLKDTCVLVSEGKIDSTSISSDISEDFTGQQGHLNSMKKRDINVSAIETKSINTDSSSSAICDQKNVDGTFSKDNETSSQRFLQHSPHPTEKSFSSDIKLGAEAPLPHASVPSKPLFHFVRDIHANLEKNDTIYECQDNEILNSSIKNSTCTNSPEPIFIQDKVSALHISETQPAKTESKEKYMKDTLNLSTVPIEASKNITLNVGQTAEYSFYEQQNNENSKVLTQNAATYWHECPQPEHTTVYNSEHSFGTSYPYYAWCVYHYSSSNGNSITQTYQGITSYEVQTPPSQMLTAIPSTVQNTHSNLTYSQCCTYFAGEPQAHSFVPANGYFPSQMPVSYNVQQPSFSQYASYQPLPQAAYPYPPDSGVVPDVPWTYAPQQQQEPFQPGH